MTTSAFTVSPKKYVPKKGDFIVLPYLNKNTPGFSKSSLPESFSKFLPPNKKGEFQLVQLAADRDNPYAVAICRLDKGDIQVRRQIKMMIFNSLREARKLGLKRVVTFLDGGRHRLCNGVQEGALLGGYVFSKYLGKKEKPIPVVLVSNISRGSLNDGRTIAECINFSRDVLNGPPVEIHPVSLSAAFAEFGTDKGLSIEVWDQKKLLREKCGGILAVGQGSKHKPKLVIGRYGDPNASIHLSLVGKGVTFDSGGYSLKPSKSMSEMKLDMGGAAMMFGAACAIASLKLPIQLSVYLPLAHNAIGQDSYNVSDVVTTRSGKTIEVLNTDAEGRIILADALSLACEQKPDFLIDSATLTGAAVVALGEEIAAVYGDEKPFVTQLLTAGETVGENLWHMPLHMGYDEQLSSIIADMKNIGGSWGGSITAALFLKRFVKDVPNWIHMDIAGPGCKVDGLEHLGEGATGFGIKTIVELAKNLAIK